MSFLQHPTLKYLKELKCYVLEDYKNWKSLFLPTSSKVHLGQSFKIWSRRKPDRNMQNASRLSCKVERRQKAKKKKKKQGRSLDYKHI